MTAISKRPRKLSLQVKSNKNDTIRRLCASFFSRFYFSFLFTSAFLFVRSNTTNHLYVFVCV